MIIKKTTEPRTDGHHVLKKYLTSRKKTDSRSDGNILVDVEPSTYLPKSGNKTIINTVGSSSDPTSTGSKKHACFVCTR